MSRAEFTFFELCGSLPVQAADFLGGESLRYPLKTKEAEK